MSIFNRFNKIISLFVLFPFFCECKTPPLQKDLIKVMSYNVLKYGDGCQGPIFLLHGYLKTIVNYTEPDVLGLVKVEAIPQTVVAKGKAPMGFADSILANAFNSTHPGKYACCPYTNAARDNNQNLLFYNTGKLGFASCATLVSDISDINIYKLYYREPNLAKTHDTAFIYFVLVHTDSGDRPDDRDRQMKELMGALRKYFAALPDIVVMGDFNLRKSSEQGYQLLTNNAEQNYRFIDPPFAIDKKAAYPANWDKHPERFSSFLTTSTRKKDKEPNDCGTGGGAKGWYDHILLSPALAGSSNYYHYVPGTYRTIGNDGNRIDRAVNDLPNKSAPQEVLNALYQMSNKYPVMLELGISPRK
jgi:endonuclease/exonuclease/phosphatase family metal-dependent hydrolase